MGNQDIFIFGGHNFAYSELSDLHVLHTGTALPPPSSSTSSASAAAIPQKPMESVSTASSVNVPAAVPTPVRKTWGKPVAIVHTADQDDTPSSNPSDT